MRANLPQRKPRSRAKQGPAFVFVDSTETRTGRPEDEDARAAIRRQAARAGRKNQRGQAVSRSDTSTPIPSNTVVRRVGSHVYTTADQGVELAGLIDPFLAPQPSLAGYEALRMKYNFDITYLTTLTDVSLGKLSVSLLQEQPALVGHLLRQQSSSFLSYLPSRYGSSPCLDAAMDCLSAGAGRMFGYPIRLETLTALYGRALHLLGAAIDNGSAYLGPDVYCATRLLTLYEVISSEEAARWIMHSRGGTVVVTARGAHNHTSPFDWMLLKSQGPSIIVDAIFNDRHTIFEAPEWQEVFKLAAQAESDPDARLWWELFGPMSFVPGIIVDLRRLCELVRVQPFSPSEFFAQSANVMERAKWVQKAMNDSHMRYQTSPPHPPSLFQLPTAPESPDRIRLRLFFFTSLMQMGRALATISESQPDRAAGELEAYTMAAQALLIPQKTADIDPAMTFHFQQRTGLQMSVVKTKALWEAEKEPKSAGELPAFLAIRWLNWHNYVDDFLNDSLDP
ncbi:hypothetical protein BJY04DRAFT_188085 [Aspergillus karnatakaensis]|uniref:uncharacterized protein n=1 Tax=Aspergillus karnatakaensis TaxID=1810916 RepID=UPI003CCD658B